MIISRTEFHRRYGICGFDTKEEKEELMSVNRLYRELIEDAPFRNHNFMFDEKTDWKNLELQEEDGIIKKFPNIKTESERYDKIKEEILNNTYESVPVSRDIDYPDVIYVENGFHRICIAWELGLEFIRVKARYGKFILEKNITFGDLISLLDMLSQLFKDKKSVISIKEYLESIITKKPEIAEIYMISYGREKKNV